MHRVPVSPAPTNRTRAVGAPWLLVRSAALLLLPLAMLNAVPASAGLKGKLKKGVYEAPAKNFKVPVPSSGMGMGSTRVNDGYTRGKPEEGDIGAVSFHDDVGNVDMILYMSLPSAPQFADAETETKALEGFVRDVVMPTWFVPASPAAQILRTAPHTFEGKRAVLALASLPGASPLMDMKTGKHMDSTRGLVAFFHGRWTYVVGTETRNVFTQVSDSQSTAPGDSAWTSFTGGLKRLYGTITFTE